METIKIWIDGKEKEVGIIYDLEECYDPHWNGLDLTNNWEPDDNHCLAPRETERRD